jgi:membrane associated rhomboid family serine protease
MRFARAVLVRPYKFTIIFLVANLFIFLLMWESSGITGDVLWRGFSLDVLITYGAKLNSLIKAPNYQWWRFVTPMFLHVNLLHLLVNMYSLWIIGPYVEKLYGSAKFVVFWVVAGVAGVVASYLTVRPNLATGTLGRFLFKTLDEPSAGASGALFGLVGVLFVFGIKFRHELPEGFKRAFGTGLLPTILINLFIGYIGRGFIDNAAHLGGMLAGAGMALVVQYKRPGESQGSALVWRVLQIAALALVALSALKVVLHFTAPPPPVQQLVVHADPLVNYLWVMNQAQQTVTEVLDGDFTNVPTTLQVLHNVPAPDQKADELRNRLTAIINKATPSPSPLTSTSPGSSASPSAVPAASPNVSPTASPNVSPTASPSASPAASPVPSVSPKPGKPPSKDLLVEYDAWRKDYEAWLKTVTSKGQQH